MTDKEYIQLANAIIVGVLIGLLFFCAGVGAAAIIGNVRDHFCAPTPKERGAAA